jgi:hypothetical protein
MTYTDTNKNELTKPPQLIHDVSLLPPGGGGYYYLQLCFYGTYCLSMLFYGELTEKQLWHATFFDRYSGMEVPSSHWILFQYLMQIHFAECSIGLLTVVMSFALGLFFGYHAWLTSRGLTTNESSKWDAINRWHRQQTKQFRHAAAHSDDVTATAAADHHNDPGPAPVNIYNRGVVENWKEVIFPLSLRRREEDRRNRSTSNNKTIINSNYNNNNSNYNNISNNNNNNIISRKAD